jgi:hypothetical protein
VAPEVRIVPATPELARLMAPRMRPADVAEVRAAAGYTPLEALLDSIENSEVSACALFDGEPACIWGVAALRSSVTQGRMGAVWMLTADPVERHPRAFWRGCRRELRRLFEFYDVLINAIDGRNEQALRWGARLGFRLDQPSPYGVEGLPFCWFSVRKEDLRCVPR